MSVTILDIMHLPSLQEARIVAGMNGNNFRGPEKPDMTGLLRG